MHALFRDVTRLFVLSKYLSQLFSEDDVSEYLIPFKYQILKIKVYRSLGNVHHTNHGLALFENPLLLVNSTFEFASSYKKLRIWAPAESSLKLSELQE